MGILSDKNQFSNDKIYFHTEKLRKVLNNGIVKPSVYELSLSGFCNCKCEYCCCEGYHSEQMLSKSDIDLISEQIKDSATAVTITGGGEPMTNPVFNYCIEKLKSNNISVGIITNGLLFNSSNIDTIAKNASFCRISLDTVNNEKYLKNRGTVLDTNKLYYDLSELSAKKNKFKTDILIGTQIVYTNQSIADIEETIKFSKSCGIDFIQIRPVDNIPNKKIDRNYKFYINHKDDMEYLKNKYSDSHFKVILNINKFEEYYNSCVVKDYTKCLGANFTAAIGHDMILYFCCAHIGNPLFAIGNLKEFSLEELLYSHKRKNLIESPVFQFCQTQCRNHSNNKLLSKLIEMDKNSFEKIINSKLKSDTPLHFEFL